MIVVGERGPEGEGERGGREGQPRFFLCREAIWTAAARHMRKGLLLSSLLPGTFGAFLLLPCGKRALSPVVHTASAAMLSTDGCDAPPQRLGQYIDSIDEAAKSLRAGGLVAFPTETVYGLGAHAMDADAVARIFTVKGRPRSDPLIVHVSTAQAAEKLVVLDPAGRALMRSLMETFWPGPLTLVAPACPELPSIITAETGFVGVRIPDHARAQALLAAADIPVAAPSANRFGHVSPTRPEHVMDDLGAHDILVLNPDSTQQQQQQQRRKRQSAAPTTCNVGIESTVVKVDAANKQLLLLRRGGIPEAELARFLAAQPDFADFSLAVQPQKHKAPPPLPPDAEAAAEQVAQAAKDAIAYAEGQPGAEGMIAPGMSLTHYAPDLPSFLVRSSDPEQEAASAVAAAAAGTRLFSVSTAVVLDFGGRLASLESRCLAYRDLSSEADAAEAAAGVFDALRWAEGRAAEGGRCVLLPDVVAAAAAHSGETSNELSAATAEMAPALADRLFRAASGRTARLAEDGASLIVGAGDES